MAKREVGSRDTGYYVPSSASTVKNKQSLSCHDLLPKRPSYESVYMYIHEQLKIKREKKSLVHTVGMNSDVSLKKFSDPLKRPYYSLYA